MKSFLSFLAVAVLLLVGASTASAQNGVFAPYVDASISGTHNSGNIGLSNPAYVFGGGIESSSTRFLFDVNGQFNTGNTTFFKSGYTGTLQGTGYLKLGGFLAGGGALYSNQVAEGGSLGSFFSSLSVNRNQVRPLVGGGYQFKRDRIIVNYVLPGKDTVAGLSSNPISGLSLGDRTFQVRNELFLGTSGLRSHLRLTQNVDFSSNRISESGARQENYTAGLGVKVVF